MRGCLKPGDFGALAVEEFSCVRGSSLWILVVHWPPMLWTGNPEAKWLSYIYDEDSGYYGWFADRSKHVGAQRWVSEYSDTRAEVLGAARRRMNQLLSR